MVITTAHRVHAYLKLLARIGLLPLFFSLPAFGQDDPVLFEKTSQIEKNESAPVSISPISRRGTAEMTAVRILSGQVELTLSAPAQFYGELLSGKTNRLSRYYVDISPASLSPSLRRSLESPDGPVQRVRIAQWRAGTVRVVLDLRGAYPCTVTTQTGPDRLLITVDGVAMVTESPSAPQAETKTSVADVTPVTPKGSAPPRAAVVAVAFTVAPDKPLKPRLFLQSTPTLLFADTRTAAHAAAPDFSPFLAQSATVPMRLVTVEQPVVSTPTFAVGWSWEEVCRESGCLQGTEIAMTGSETVPALEEPVALVTVPAEAPREALPAAEEAAHDFNQREGAIMMYKMWVIVIGVGVLLSFLAGVGVMLLWTSRKRGVTSAEQGDGWETRMAYLEEAVNRAGMLNSSFFHSLGLAQKRLETLLTQADLAEQNLRRLLHQAAFAGEKPATRTTDAYATAALLLAEGEEVQQVARVLKLPLAQVRVLRELQQHGQQEKTAETETKTAAPTGERAAVSVLEDLKIHLNGVKRGGMHLAQNGQHL